jgi:hypothetical protein
MKTCISQCRTDEGRSKMQFEATKPTEEPRELPDKISKWCDSISTNAGTRVFLREKIKNLFFDCNKDLYEENAKLRGEVQALEAWQDVAAQSNRDVSAYLQESFPQWGSSFDEGIPVDNIRQVIEHLDSQIKSQPYTLDVLSASEALFGFMGWLTTRDAEVTFSEHHDAGVAVDLVSEFCKVNNLKDPSSGWDKNLTHPTKIIGGNTPVPEKCISEPEIPWSKINYHPDDDYHPVVDDGGFSLPHVKSGNPPITSSILNLAEEALSKLSGDLNYNNVAEAKMLLKEILKDEENDEYLC